MEEEKKLKKVLEENGVRLLKSDNICVGEQIPLPNGIVGIIHEETGLNMDYKIQHTYEVTQTHEFSVDWNGFNFLIIYGHHINGWFAAFPNWNKCTEMGEPENVYYNATKLAQKHIHDIAPMCLAQAIKEHWEGLEK